MSAELSRRLLLFVSESMQSFIMLTNIIQMQKYTAGFLRSGKTERVRGKSVNFKIPLTRPIIYALFSQFLSASGGFSPQTPIGATPL